MLRRMVGHRVLASVVLAVVLATLAACGQSAPPPQPTQAPKPAAPAAQPTAAQPAAPTTAAAQPTAAAKPAQVLELRAGTTNPQGDVLSNAVDKFSELVKQKSNGQLNVRVFYQSLGVEQQLTESVMSGSVDFGQISNGNAGRFTDAYMVYDLPFLFKQYDNMLKSLDGPLGQKAIGQFEKDLGVKMMFPISWAGGRDVQTRTKQLKVPADIKGIKIRTVSTPVDLGTFKAWGANPTPVDWAQTYAALQQGVVDGMGVPLSQITGGKYYEVVKYNLRVDYQAIFNELFMNAKKFASLTPEQQKILLDSAKEAQAWQREDARKAFQANAKDLVEKYGMQVYTPTPAEYDQWAAVRETVWKDVADQMKGKIDLDLAKQIYQAQ